VRPAGAKRGAIALVSVTGRVAVYVEQEPHVSAEDAIDPILAGVALSVYREYPFGARGLHYLQPWRSVSPWALRKSRKSP
jgi:hypothetical protein